MPAATLSYENQKLQQQILDTRVQLACKVLSIFDWSK